MIQQYEVFEKLEAIESGSMASWEFYDWLSEASPNMHMGSSIEAMNLVIRIKNLFADFDARFIGEKQLKKSLIELIQREPVYVVQPFGYVKFHWHPAVFQAEAHQAAS